LRPEQRDQVKILLRIARLFTWRTRRGWSGEARRVRLAEAADVRAAEFTFARQEWCAVAERMSGSSWNFDGDLLG
jgi:hypothetical protein